MLQSIPDSDEEYGEITTSMISSLKVARLLLEMPSNKRNEVGGLLKIKYSSLLTDQEWDDPELAMRRYELLRNGGGYKGEDGDDLEDDLFGNTTSNTATANTTTSAHSTPNKTDSIAAATSAMYHEDESNLKIYLDSNNYETTTRRGLRKRNFSSTHPYLADQAHYLGLTRVEYLNEMFEESGNVEDIIRFLNHSYIHLKKSSRKDDKFKANNFYALLGKQSLAASEKEKEDDSQTSQNQVYEQPTQEITFPPSQASQPDFDWDIPSNLDDDVSFLKHHNRVVEVSDQESMSDGSESNGDEHDVPKKSVYKFVLPESTKHLEHAPRIRKKEKPKIVKYGKGVAVKKKAIQRRDDFQLINDNVEDDDQQVYLRYDNSAVQEELDIYRQLLVSLEESESEVEEIQQNNEREFWFADQPEIVLDEDNKEFLVDRISNDSDDSVQEYDSIDTMHSRPTERKKYALKSLSLNRATRNSNTTKKQLRLPATKSKGSSRSASSTRTRNDLPKPPTATSRTRNDLPKPPTAPSRTRNDLPTGETGTKRKINQHYTPTRPRYSGPQKFKHYNRKLKAGTLTKKPFQTTRKLKASKKAPEEPIHMVNALRPILPTLKQARQHTIPFEAESTTKMIKPINFHKPKRAIDPSNMSSFPNSFILNAVNVEKVYEIQNGKTYATHEDTVNIEFAGEFFSLTLVDVKQSTKSCERLLVLLVKRLKDTRQLVLAPHVVDQIYECIKGLLKWFLINQEEISEKIWKCLRLAITLLTKSPHDMEVGEICMFLYPYFCLLWFTLSSVSKSQDDEFISETSLYLFYWRFYFQHYDSSITQDRMYSSKKFESFHVMVLILNVEELWWSLINNSLVKACTEVDIETVMEGLFSLAFEAKSNSFDWKPFYTLYSQIDIKEDSQIFLDFLNLTSSLHQRLGWPLEELMILKVYNTITNRKFANFPDEQHEPRVIGRIRSRNDIPENSFFERFMYLFYSFVSDTALNKKRFITKLITSSHYIYENNKNHRIMFVNRLNFLQLLSQISDVDLKNQLYDLVVSVADSGDKHILGLSIEAVSFFSDIAMEKSMGIPVQCFSVIANTIDILKGKLLGLIKQLFKIIRAISLRPGINVLYLIQCLEVYTKLDAFDTLPLEVYQIFLECIDVTMLRCTKVDPKFLEVLDKFTSMALKALSNHMGRFPLPSVSEENRVEVLVETLLKIWVRSNSLSPHFRGDKLILQTFPYIGNSQLREKFSLLFYFEILQVTNLQELKDLYVIALLKSLASYTPSKYLPQLMNQLNRYKNEVVIFQAKYIPEVVSNFHLLNFRSRLVLNILTNIASTTKIQNVTKLIYLEEFLKTINSEFDKYFSSSAYKEFCIRSIKSVQKICGEYIRKNGMLDSCASKLGISKLELSSYEWSLTPLKGKLTIVHTELSQAIHFSRDIYLMLDRYALGHEVELIYHLVSIYIQAPQVYQTSKWKFVYLLLLYFYDRVRLFKFDIINNDFVRFLNLLASMGSLDTPSGKNDRLYYLKNCLVVGDTLRYLRVLFDGYGDRKLAESIIEKFVKSSGNQVEYFSKFRLSDIQDSNAELQGGVHADPSQDEIAIAHTAVVVMEDEMKRPDDTLLQPVVLEYDFLL